MRPTKIILGTHMDKGLMYCVYQNHTATAYSSLYLIFLSLQFSNIKIFVTLFSGIVRLYKVETWYTCGQWVGGCCCLFVPSFLHFSSSPISNNSFLSLFIRNRETYIHVVENRYTRGQWVDAMYTGIRLLLLLYFFIFLSLQFYFSSFFCLSN